MPHVTLQHIQVYIHTVMYERIQLCGVLYTYTQHYNIRNRPRHHTSTGRARCQQCTTCKVHFELSSWIGQSNNIDNIRSCKSLAMHRRFSVATRCCAMHWMRCTINMLHQRLRVSSTGYNWNQMSVRGGGGGGGLNKNCERFSTGQYLVWWVS